MSYDYENRMTRHELGSVVTKYTYSGDGLKRSEREGSEVTTLVWDGSDYLGEV
ncbi:hypothetical protein QM565_30480 [Geitlerinema splendidum]|nr:hypothetical protein [Geitlerinema splendidum]